MINRILIRIKAVQMLYAYLLTRSEFKIDGAPDTNTRDRRFAYTVYINMLLLIVELSGSSPRSRAQALAIPAKLRDNRVGRALADTDAIKEAFRKDSKITEALRACVPALLEAIEQSAAYKEYARKRKTDLDIDVKLWSTLLGSVVAKSEQIEKVLRESGEFTQVGFEAGCRQAIATLEAYNDTRAAYVGAKAELQRSLDKAYELYHYLMALMVELTDAQAEKLENAKNKYLATAEDRNPNTRFIDNQLISRIKDSEQFNDFMKAHPMRWADEPALIKSLLDSIVTSQIYADYMAAPTTSYTDDCNLWRNLLKNVILPSDQLADELERRSIYWNDDLEIMATFVLKTISQFAKSPDAPVELLPMYKDEEDARFGDELFRLAVDNRELYRSYIDRFINSDQWDSDRMAFMDVVIMTCAIAELLNYPAIPVPVTLNEYIEIANAYSTSRSGQFINGLLYALVNWLRSEGILLKA